MKLKCKCGSDQFVRRWVGVDIHTPCTIDTESKTVRMDFSREEQSEDRSSRVEYYCAKCDEVIDRDLTMEVVTEYSFE